jgi:hypothetical protein
MVSGHACNVYPPGADLLPHKRFLYRRQVLERREQHMGKLGPADKVYELAQFLAQLREDLIFVFNGLCNLR